MSKKSLLVSIRGVRPLFLHAFNESVLDKKKKKSGTAGNNIEVSPDKIYLGLKCPEEEQLTRDPEQPVYLDVRSVVNPMKTLLINSGIMCGIGFGRSIGMGRFEILSISWIA
jgi:hypothetical protein